MDLEDLLRAYRNHDESVGAPLTAGLLELLRCYFLSFGFAPPTADDLTQDTAMVVLDKLPGLPEKRSYRAWVLTVARNKGIDLHRKQGRQLETSLGRAKGAHAGQRRPSSVIHLERWVIELDKLIAELPALWRDVIECDLDGGDVKALARRANISDGALRAVRVRALARLRAKLSAFLRESR